MKKYTRSFMISLILCLLLGACSLPWDSSETDQVNVDEPTVTTPNPIPAMNTAKTKSVTPQEQKDTNNTASISQPEQQNESSNPCDKAQFIADVTIPDGSSINAGDQFTKTWKLRNIGSCTWTTDYVLTFQSGNKLGGANVSHLNNNVAPGEGINVSVDLTAPSTAGSYKGYWQMRNSDGKVIPIEGGYQGNSFYVDIVVTGSQNQTQPVVFAVTNVTFTVSHTGFCGKGVAYLVQADITTNGAGKVDYQWIHSQTGNYELPKLLIFNAAGTQTVTVEYKPGITPPFTGMWMDLYINDPNGQQFGRAELNCQ